MKNNIRQQESLSNSFESLAQTNKLIKNQHLILTASTDNGVIRNLGRQGARYAPRSILHCLRKMNNHIQADNFKIYTQEISDNVKEQSDFAQAQKVEANSIVSALKSSCPKLHFHIGGGHDHIFPYLYSFELDENIDEICVLNIDAHCDTRVSDEPNSGTPFRDFANQTQKKFNLIQYGIQDYSNSVSTLSKLTNANVETIDMQTISQNNGQFNADLLQAALEKMQIKPHSKMVFILSLDCDGIDGSQMPAVSCVNPNGISVNHMNNIIEFLKNKKFENFGFGIYEFNPLYDSLSNLGSKTIASFIYQLLD